MKLVTLTIKDLAPTYREFLSLSKKQQIIHYRKILEKLKYDIPVSDETIYEDVIKPDALLVTKALNFYNDNYEELDKDAPLKLELFEQAQKYIFHFFVLAIEYIERSLENNPSLPEEPTAKIKKIIDLLFDDRAFLKDKITLLRKLIQGDTLTVNILQLNEKVKQISYPDADFTGVVELSSYLQLISITERLHEINSQYSKKIFNNEFFIYVILHELLHVLIFAGDDTYLYDENSDDIPAYNIYSPDRLKPEEIENADNYASLIFNVLKILHEEKIIELK